MDCLWLALAIAYLNVLDYYTTRIASRLGMRDRNPLLPGDGVDVVFRTVSVGIGLILSGVGYCAYSMGMLIVYSYAVLVNTYFIQRSLEYRW